MESFSKKYKITPFMLIFMTPLVSILYNVRKLVRDDSTLRPSLFPFIQSIMGYFHHFSYKNDDTGLEKCT